MQADEAAGAATPRLRARPDGVGRASWLPSLVLAAVVLVGLTLAQTSAGAGVLARLGLSTAPKTYTALSFADVASLPSSAVSGRPLSFPVTIGNQRSDAVRYRITVTGAGSARAAGTGSVLIPAGATRTVDVRVAFRCRVPGNAQQAAALPPDARVVLALSPTGESITHAMYCRAA